MSQLARDAGDAQATAWWELQTRYYLKRIEGDNTPESPYQQWTIVWLVILHGDFAGRSWRYWLLDQDSHNVLSQAQSDRPFDTTSHDIQPMPGPINARRRLISRRWSEPFACLHGFSQCPLPAWSAAASDRPAARFLQISQLFRNSGILVRLSQR